MKTTFEFIHIIDELEQVELAPFILPCLKMIDPIAREIPEGSVKRYLTRIRPREGQFRFIEKLTPHLPTIVRWAGKIAAIKPLMIVFAVICEALALIFKLLMPVLSVCIRSVSMGVGVVKKNFNRIKH